MDRIRRGFRLLGRSWEVLKADKELIGLAALSLVAMVVVGGIAAGLYLGIVGTDADPNGTVGAVIGIPLYFTLTFIGVFTTASLVGAATIRLWGGDPTIGDGVRLAWSRVDKLVGWTLVTGTVGLILRAIRERAGWLGNIIGALAEMAWEVITFLAVPVLLYEDEGPWSAVRRSAHLFRQRWGEQLVGNAALGLALFLVGIPVFAVVALVGAVLLPLGILLGVLAVGTLVSAGAALSGIFRAALYHYAVQGEPVGPFSDDDLSGAFVTRGRRRF